MQYFGWIAIPCTSLLRKFHCNTPKGKWFSMPFNILSWKHFHSCRNLRTADWIRDPCVLERNSFLHNLTTCFNINIVTFIEGNNWFKCTQVMFTLSPSLLKVAKSYCCPFESWYGNRNVKRIRTHVVTVQSWRRPKMLCHILGRVRTCN